MSILKKIFGRETSPEAPSGVEYKGFRIIADPVAEGGKYRLSARIERDQDGEIQVHHVIRADVLDTKTVAEEVSLNKAKQVIDEQGDRLFE